MEGVADGEGFGLAALGGPGGADLGYVFGGSGDDGVAGCVQGGDAYVAVVFGEVVGEFVGGGGDGGHAAAFGESAHEGGAGGDESAGVRQIEDTGHMGGGDFPDGVADDGVRGDAGGGEEPGEGDVEGEESGLGVGGVVQQLRVFGLLAEDHLAQRLLQVGIQEGADLVEGFGEDGEAVVQRGAHAGPLAALTAEQEHRLPRNTRSASGTYHGRVRCAGGQGLQPRRQFLAVLANNDGAVVEERARHQQRPAHLHRCRVVLAADVLGQGRCLPSKGLCAMCGHQPRHGSADGGNRRHRIRSLL